MRIKLDLDKLGSKNLDVKKKINSKMKMDSEKPRDPKKISPKSKSIKINEKIGAEFIDSIKYTHIPGKLSIEIGYSLENHDEDRQGIHVKTLNIEQIKGLKRFLNIFED